MELHSDSVRKKTKTDVVQSPESPQQVSTSNGIGGSSTMAVDGLDLLITKENSNSN